MKNTPQTTLLGRGATRTGDTSNRPHVIVAVWQSGETLTVAMEPANCFGKAIGGPLVTADIGQVHLL